MADRSVELYTALYAALSGHAALTALIGAGRVHDHVRPGATLPYVVIGDETANDASGDLVDAQEHTVTVHCWSETPSSLQVKQMLATVRGALHGLPPALAAGTCANLRCEFKETMRDPDGITWHGVLRFRAVTQD